MDNFDLDLGLDDIGPDLGPEAYEAAAVSAAELPADVAGGDVTDLALPEVPPDPFDSPDAAVAVAPTFGSVQGISNDSYQEPVSWSHSYQGFYGEQTGRPMEPE